MFLLFVVILVVASSPVSTETRALRFGQTEGDYIEWYPDVSTATTQLSVCSWLRNRYQGRLPYARPVVLGYSPHYWYYGLILGSDGYFNYVVNAHLNLRTRSEWTVPDRQWFHVCWTWSTSDYTTRVYLNGNQIGSVVTRGNYVVETGGVMCLGNHGNVGQDSKDSTNIFGGDMYEMNMYNRVLVQSEIRRMASNICSQEEERLTTNRIIKWEEILLKSRTGSVTEFSSGCTVTLSEVLRRLQNTEQELAKTKTSLERSEEKLANSLASTQGELDSTKQELIEYESNLRNTQIQLDSTKQELTAVKKNLTKQLENVTLALTSTLVKLNNTDQDLAETKTDLKISEEKLQNVTMSLNHTLEQLEAAKRNKVRSKWDVLYSDKFLNKKLTGEMSHELKSTGNVLGLFVGMNITEELITYLKRRHEEDMVCLNTGN